MGLSQKPRLMILLLLLLTLGQAYPYGEVYQHFFNQNCECCVLKKKGCSHCAQFGHKTPRKKLSCHQGKTHSDTLAASPQLTDIPCNGKEKKEAARFITEPFLLPQSSILQLLPIAKTVRSFQASLERRVEPPPVPPPIVS